MWVTGEPVRLQRRFAGHADVIMLARGPRGWLLTTLGQHGLRVDEVGDYQSGQVLTRVDHLTTVDELRAMVIERYYHSGWVDLLDAVWRDALELYAWWVPHQIARELDRVSVYDSGLDTRALDATIRQVAAGALRDAGYRTLVERDPRSSDDLSGNRVVGAITVQRHGWEFQVLVGLDDAGEVYVRIPDRDTPAHRQGWRELDDEDAAGR